MTSVPLEMDSDLHHHQVELDQNLDQISLIDLINLDPPDSSTLLQFNPLPLQFSSLGGLEYYHHHPHPHPHPVQHINSNNDNISNTDSNNNSNNNFNYNNDDHNNIHTNDNDNNLALFNNINPECYSFELDNPLGIIPPTTSSASSSCAPPSSPSWSPLDQLLFPPLNQHPQSSPLFPFDLVPSWQDSTGDSNKEPDLNPIDFSTALDSRLEDWSLIFDSIQPNQDSYSNQELAQFFHTSGSKECEPHQQPSLPELQAGPVRPTAEYLGEFSRSTGESDRIESGLYPIHSDPTDFASPLSSNGYNHAVPMKRKLSTNSAMVEADLFSFDSIGMHFIKSSMDQQAEANKENINSESMQDKPKNKRPKTSASNSTSKSKSHVCTECGKAFPRLTSLSQHKLTHNGERPYRCSFEGCNKSFTTSSNSKRHWRTHF